jgi:hypothetical protein
MRGPGASADKPLLTTSADTGEHGSSGHGKAKGAVKLPYCELAIVSDAKLVDYLLNAEHPQGRGKAAFFSGLGYRREQPEILRRALLELATATDVTETRSAFGRKFSGRGEVLTPSGRTMALVTVWMLPDGQPPPQLVTAYPSR